MRSNCAFLLILATSLPVVANNEGELKYHTYETMRAELKQHELNHPDLCKLFDLGLSSDNTTRMWALKISDNVGQEEDEPHVLLSAAIHGNERPSTEMALYVIDHILKHPERHKNLINNTQIWIIPMLNSAGHSANTRANANRVDLNRGFPQNFDNPSLEDAEPEIKNLLQNFFAVHDHVVAGIDLHTYGEVVLVPWARSRKPPADHEALNDLAKEMAAASRYRHMPIVQFTRRPIFGGGADYRYGAHGTFYYGLELGRSHHPPAKQFEANL